MDLEEPMMEVVQTHIIPSQDTLDQDVLQVGHLQFLLYIHIENQPVYKNDCLMRLRQPSPDAYDAF